MGDHQESVPIGFSEATHSMCEQCGDWFHDGELDFDIRRHAHPTLSEVVKEYIEDLVVCFKCKVIMISDPYPFPESFVADLEEQHDGKRRREDEEYVTPHKRPRKQ